MQQVTRGFTNHLTTLFVAGLMLVAPLWAAERAQIGISPFTPEPGQTFTITVNGVWPNSCAPGFERLDELNGALIIHVTSPQSNCVNIDTPYQFEVQPGEPFGDLFGQPQVVPLKLFWREQGETLARLHAFELLSIAGQAPTQPETGMWWATPGSKLATSGPGIGFSLEIQDQRLAMMANLYDPQGQATWYLSSGQILENVARADLLSLEGGQALFTDYSRPEVAVSGGRTYLEFHSHGKATAWFTAPANNDPTSELLLHPIELSRYLFAWGGGTSALSGQWLLHDNGDSQQFLTTQVDFSQDPVLKSEFVDSFTGLRLVCDPPASQQQQLPNTCTMIDLNEGIYQFDNIGLNRISGIGPNGQPVTLTRLSSSFRR